VLKAGQYASVRADIGMPMGVVLVPQRAVNSIQGVNNLWVVGSDGTVEYRPVTLGETFGDMWVVESGLRAGEVVLTDGVQKVRAGDKVKYTLK
jgi:multidrug efflux pump subunit AcrA (membrane-fusion protein)